MAARILPQAQPVSDGQTLVHEPLVQETPLEVFLNNKMINSEQSEASLRRRITNIAMKAIGATLVVVGRMTLINVTISYTGNNAGGWILVLGDFLGYSALYIWALFRLIDELTSLNPEELSDVTKKDQNLIYKISTIVFSVLFAFVTKLPQAYVAYEFNDKNIFMPLILLASNFSLTAYSVKKSIDYLVEKLSSDRVDKKLLTAKKTFIRKLSILKENYDESLNLNHELKMKETCRECIDFLLIKSKEFNITEEKTKLEKIFDITSLVFGLALTVCYLYFLTYVAYSGTLTYLDSLAGAIVVALGVLFGNMYITKAVVVDSLRSYMKSMSTCIKRRLSYYQKNSPWLFSTLLITAIFFSLISWGSIPSVVDKYFSPKALQLFLGITCSITVVTFNLTPMLALVQRIVRKKFSWFPDELSKIMNMNEKMTDRFLKAVEVLDCKNFALALSRLNDDLKAEFLEETNLTEEEVMMKAALGRTINLESDDSASEELADDDY